nr:hypothetical protein [Rhodoferax sp.]
MIHRIFVGLVCALLLQGAAWAAKPPTKQSSFSAALAQTSLGSDPAQAYFLLGLLKDVGGADEDVDALRRELLHSYVEQLGGQVTPQRSVTAAVAQGKTRGSVLDAQFVGTWQAAFDKGLDIRWPDGEGPVPYFAIVYRSMRSVAPGVWVSESSNGQVQFMLSLRVINKTALPLPIQRPDLILGGESGTGRGGLAFVCNWDRPQPPAGSAKLDEVVMLAPGAESDALACEAPPTGAYWRQRLLSAVADVQKGVARPLWVSHELDTPSRLLHLEGALAGLANQAADWRLRLQASQQEVGRQWTHAEKPLEPPVAKKWALSPHDGWPAAGKKLQLFLGATGVALLMFGAGRAMLRAGLPVTAVTLTTLLAGAGVFAVGMAMTGGGGGSGYDSPFYLGIALYSAVVGPMLLGVWALHAVQKLLDTEDLTWGHTVFVGWRRAVDATSATSRAEFWGFFVHCVWWWVLARVCLAPLDRWVGAALLVPFMTLIVRRLLSLTRAELLGVAIALVCLVVTALA